MGLGEGVGRDGELKTWIWRNENQRGGVRNWNRDGDIGPDANGDWGDGERK